MKQVKVAAFVVLAVFVAGGVAFADSLAVNHTAALGGTGTACSGGNCGLAVFHDNSSVAYVEDQTPNAETTYRGSFLFNPNNISAPAINYRQTIFGAFGKNPTPGTSECPVNPAAIIASFRIFFYQTCAGCPSTQFNVQAFTRGNWCGERATARIQIGKTDTKRICWEWITGASYAGYIAIAVVDPTAACPVSGDAAWSIGTVSNNLCDIGLVRMGTPQTNAFAAGESGTFYFDEFESYRTLTP